MRKLAVAAVLSISMISNAAMADDNCGQLKDSLSHQLRIVEWGNCYWALYREADAEGALLCAKVIGRKGIPTESGHKIVENWTYFLGAKINLPNTSLSYCGGHPVAAIRGIETPPSEDEVRKQIQQGLDKLQQEAPAKK
jgi:hypothetical protein